MRENVVRQLGHLVWVCLAMACIAFVPDRALSDVRVALVVGNSAYPAGESLENPRNDAEDLAAKLQSIGFSTVVLKKDLKQRDFLQALKSFQGVATQSDIALVYYAGHAVEVNGTNYMVPIDAQMRRAVDAEFDAVSLDQLRLATRGAKKLRLVILDACRNNPFQFSGSQTSRSLSRGLAAVTEPSANELVAYAARAGTLAADGTGHRNSPFAAALLRNLSEPGLEVRQFFGRVRDQVIEATGTQQEPFTYGAMGGEAVYLHAQKERQGLVGPTAHISAVPMSDAAAAWNSIKDTNSVSVLSAFRSSFPGTVWAAIAEARILDLQANIAPTVKRSESPQPIADQTSDEEQRKINQELRPRRADIAILPPPFEHHDRIAHGEELDESTIRRLQEQLRRLGCYRGTVDGDWGEDSKSAWRLFLANTKQPLDKQPATADLSTLAKFDRQICTMTCPQGQVINVDR